jgi:hypothetical protein
MKNYPVNSQNIRRKSTYQLLVQSEENKRSYVESVAYLLLILATCASIWQFGRQPVNFAGIGNAASQNVASLQSPVARI